MSVYRLLIELIGKDKGATRALRKTRQEMKGVKEEADRMEQVLKLGAAALGIAYVGKRAIEAAWDLGVLGAQAARTEKSFDRLAGRIGETGEELLQTMKKAADGTVDDMTLMQVTAGLLASGIKTSSSEIALALDIARLKAQQFGISTTEAYSRMLTGARKFSVEMLDEIGIVIKAESAYKRRADALGVTVKALTDAQRAEALWLAILADGKAEIEAYGGAVDDNITKQEQLDATVKNLKVSLGKLVDPHLTSAAEGLYVLAEAAQGNRGPLEELQRQQERTQLWIDEAGKSYIRGASGALIYSEALTNLRNGTQIAVATGDSWIVKLDAQKAAEEAAAAATTNLTWTVYSLEGAMQQTLSTGAAFEQMWYGIGAAANEAGIAMDALMHDLETLSREELGGAFGGDVGRLDTGLLGLLGDAPMSVIRGLREDYQAEIRALYDDVAFQIAQGTDVSAFEIELQAQTIYDKYQGMIDVIEGSTDRISDALKDQQRAWDNLKSTVAAALGGGTQVTALDVQQTALGAYADKWDEDARRLDAVAARGFAELEAHPDWAGILEIPPEILGSTETVLKNWAGQQADNMRNLLLPMDKSEIARAVEVVRDYIQQQAQREANIEAIAVAYTAQYGGTEEQARAALGDTAAAGGIAADDVMEGFTAALEATTPAAQFARYFKTDLKAAEGSLRDRGIETWQIIEKAMLDEMAKGNLAEEFAQIMAPWVEIEIRKNRQNTGGTGGETGD